MYLSGPGRCAAFLSELHRPPFANAAAGGHWAVARLIVEGGGDPDDGGWVDGDGAPRNLLEAAVARGDDAFAEALVAAGAAADGGGALRAAAARGAAGVV